MTLYKITLLITAPDEFEDGSEMSWPGCSGNPICPDTVLEAAQECGTQLAADLDGEFDDNDATVEEVSE